MVCCSIYQLSYCKHSNGVLFHISVKLLQALKCDVVPYVIRHSVITHLLYCRMLHISASCLTWNNNDHLSKCVLSINAILGTPHFYLTWLIYRINRIGELFALGSMYLLLRTPNGNQWVQIEISRIYANEL